MNKHDWWDSLDSFEKASVKAAPKLCGQIFETFGPFTISHETFEGVEPLPKPKCHISWTAYEAYKG